MNNTMRKKRTAQECVPEQMVDKRTRFIFDIDPLLRNAIMVRAADQTKKRKRKVCDSEIVTEILTQALADDMAYLLSDKGA